MSDFDRLMSDSLKGIRNEHLKQIETEVPVARRQLQEELSGRRFRFVVGGLAVAAAALAAIVFVTQTLPRIDRSAPIRPAGEPVVLARIDVPGVGAMEPGLDGLWVAHEEGLSGIDPATSTVKTESPSKGVEEMAFNSEAMYAINSGDRGISRIPFGTNEAAAAIQIEGTPTAVAASDDTVWVAAAVGPVGDSQILRHTPSLDVMQEDSEPAIQDRVVADMTYADGALWMSASGRNGELEVYGQYDSGDRLRIWELSESEGGLSDIEVGEGAVWVLRQPTKTGGNSITRLDLETDDVSERGVSFEDPIESIAVGEGYLWVTTAPTRMNMPDDVRASLHRIDPSTLEEVGAPLEVAGPGSKLAVGYGYVWVGDPNNKQIVQIDPYGKASPEPEESTPEPQETDGGEMLDHDCLDPVPFEPGYQPHLWTTGVGSGGANDVRLEDQGLPAVIHFQAGPRRFINVTSGEPPFQVTGGEPVQVLGTEGTVSPIGEGAGYISGRAITFTLGNCTYQLQAFGFDDGFVRLFAEGLVPRGEAGLTNDAFALWPEATPEAAYTACSDPDRGGSLSDPKETAVSFAQIALRWRNAEVDDGFIMNAKEGWAGYHVLRDGSGGSPGAVVMVREVASGCWHVNSVRTFNADVPEDAPTGLSVDSREGETTVGFDLEREAAGRDVAWVRLIVGPGQLLLSTEEFESLGYIRLMDAPVGAPTYFLVLLLDEDRDVVGAIGQPLPSGDFSAG